MAGSSARAIQQSCQHLIKLQIKKPEGTKKIWSCNQTHQKCLLLHVTHVVIAATLSGILRLRLQVGGEVKRCDISVSKNKRLF